MPALAFGFAMLALGCSSGTSKKQPDPEAGYRKALAATNPSVARTVKPGSTDEQRAIERFVDFYKVFSADVVKNHVRETYAAGAYFRDPFHEVIGIDAIEKYFLDSTETFHECRFDIEDVAKHDGNYYFRWVMHLKLEKDDPVMDTIGLTHVRFDELGMISFHQDYWDAGSAVYEKIPLLGSLVRFVKGRIRGG
ncbi:MAG: nuclear transport factor 2 family protein [Candidatus Binatia bacterium]